MSLPATGDSINQLIAKLDSLPNSARDAAVSNSISLSDSLSRFGEGVLKLYSESNPSAREAIVEMFELVCNEPLDNWLDRIDRICDGFSKQKRPFGNSIRFPKRLPMPSIRKDGPSKTMTYVISDIWKSSGRQTLPATTSYSPSTCAAKIWTLLAIG